MRNMFYWINCQMKHEGTINLFYNKGISWEININSMEKIVIIKQVYHISRKYIGSND